MTQNKKKYKGDVEESKIENSALIVNDGVQQPPQINPYISKVRKQKQILSIDDYVDGILSGNVNILGRAITLIESTLHEHFEISQRIIEKCLKYEKPSIRIGITGVPGVGKSTFIEALGMHIVNSGHKLAVLAVDPSSERSGGSILGDKTRMEDLAAHSSAFIRPSPSAGSLGGVARKTRETIILCEAAGYDTIFIETVGVGQSETVVHSMVDFFLLLMLAGAGDELQGIKRGIMEMADTIAINKADGSNIQKANLAKAQYENALHLFPPTDSDWYPKVITCSALENKGIVDIWDTINEYLIHVKSNGFYQFNRNNQAKYWMFETINAAVKDKFYQNKTVGDKLKQLQQDVIENKISSFVAAKTLLDLYFSVK